MSARHLTRLRDDDDGQLVLLIIGFTVIGAMLVAVVANVSRVFLYERSLAAAADGAAVAASSALDESAVYAETGGLGDRLPLDPVEAERRVADYAAQTELPQRFRDFRCAVDVSGGTVSVAFTARVDLRFVGAVAAGYTDGVPISVTANARSPVR
jgi:hypothetical protein